MTVKILGVIGSGIMGAGITEVAAIGGHEVVLRSRDLAGAKSTLAAIDRSLGKRVHKGSLDPVERAEALARISVTDDLHDLARCDLVLESIVEDLPTKQRLFSELDRICEEHTILATNTSTLPVVEMAMQTGRPAKVCGIHFFNPVPLMGLVEVVRPITADEETITEAKAFAGACGKSAIVVADQAGFVVNALLFPYLNSAVRLLEHGVASMEDIDEAMKGGCGFPMGPFALLDLVGLDTTVLILDALFEERREAACAAVPRLRRMVAAGRLGRKSGGGFYQYSR